MREKDLRYFLFAGSKEIKKLYKDLLYQVEDLRDDGHIPEEAFEKTRKRILDKGNDAIRSYEEEIENYFFLNGE